MRTITKKYKIYKFNELTDKAKNKAIDNYINTWHGEGGEYILSESLSELLTKLLDKNNIKYDELPKIYYSLNYSQGDGAMFYGNVNYKNSVINIEHKGFYYHYNSKDITSNDNNFTDKKYKEFNDIYINICNELESLGYKLIEEYTNSDNIAEFLSDYEFYGNGAIYY